MKCFPLQSSYTRYYETAKSRETAVYAVSRLSVFTTQTRKIKLSSILFCIGILICNGSVWLQLSRFYGLPPLVLSIYYHDDVITLA